MVDSGLVGLFNLEEVASEIDFLFELDPRPSTSLLNVLQRFRQCKPFRPSKPGIKQICDH